MEKKLKTRAEIASALRSAYINYLETEVGCDFRWRAKSWKRLTNAKTQKVHYDSADKEFHYSKKMKDNAAQIKALENISKMAGDYPAEKHELQSDQPLQVNVVKFADREK